MTARPRLSDHALIRILDRGAGCDIEDLRARLEASMARAHLAARSISQSDYLLRVDGLTFVVRGDTVTTVMTDTTPAGRAHALVRFEESQ